jgi:hypothetical protein
MRYGLFFIIFCWSFALDPLKKAVWGNGSIPSSFSAVSGPVLKIAKWQKGFQPIAFQYVPLLATV